MEFLKPVAVKIRYVTPADAAKWERLRHALWPDGDDHAGEIASFFAGTLAEPAAVLFAESEDGEVLGYAELSIRTDLPGLADQRTGYVEGLYVLPKARSRGVARQLMQESRHWARKQRCVAFASDRAARIVIDRTYSRLPPNAAEDVSE